MKVREYHADMHCDVLRVVGHRIECKCGWRSATLPTLHAARYALARHREAGHAESVTREPIEAA